MVFALRGFPVFIGWLGGLREEAKAGETGGGSSERKEGGFGLLTL